MALTLADVGRFSAPTCLAHLSRMFALSVVNIAPGEEMKRNEVEVPLAF